MAYQINCENPTCGTRIDVPDGAMQVICPQCNTWHFPSAISPKEEAGSHSSEQYNMPQMPPMDSGTGVGFGEPPVPPIAVEPVSDNSSNTRGASREVGTIGCLLTIDGTQLTLRQGKNIIGRKSGDLIIHDKTVSRAHCVVEVNMKQGGQGWEFIIYDIGHLEGQSSTNGVFISGRSLRLQDYERIPIYHDTSIKLGNVMLVLKCE